jgi:hypothetical protein
MNQLVLKGDALKNPLIKKFIKQQEKDAKRAEIEAKIPALLAEAKDIFGREFHNVRSILNYVSPSRSGKKKSKRGSRITKELKAKVKELRAANKSDDEIATELSLKVQQVKRVK